MYFFMIIAVLNERASESSQCSQPLGHTHQGGSPPPPLYFLSSVRPVRVNWGWSMGIHPNPLPKPGQTAGKHARRSVPALQVQS